MHDDRRWYENAATAAQRRMFARFHSSESELENKYPIALAAYAVLAVLVWFTVGEGSVMVYSRPVQIRLIPIAILALFALRTFLAMQADRIRRGDEKKGS
jgi:hypothetical protein